MMRYPMTLIAACICAAAVSFSTAAEDAPAEAPVAEKKLTDDAKAKLLKSAREDEADAALSAIAEFQRDAEYSVEAKVEFLPKLIEAFLSRDGLSAQLRDAARGLGIVNLYQAARGDEKYFKQFNERVDKLLQEHPKSRAAAMGRGFQLALKYVFADLDQGQAAKLTKQAMKDFTAFHETYPRSSLGLQLFHLFAERLQENNPDKAAEFLRKGLELYPRHPQAIMLKITLRQLEIVGKPMEIAGPTLDGEKVDIDKLKGKVVIVDFWASWCRPCIVAMPELKRLYAEYKEQGLQIIGVNLDNQKKSAVTAVDRLGLKWPNIFFGGEQVGFDNPLARKYEIQGIPAMFIVDRDGKVVATDLHGEELRRVIAEQIRKQS